MRLNDAEILTDYIVEHDLAFEYAIQRQDRKELERLITEIPTAYDPYKVVAQLEELGKECEDPLQDYAPNYFIEKAIEIVKGGGVDGKEQSQ